MDKLKMQTPNLVDENVKKIAKLFPEVVTEIEGEDGKLKRGVDFDLLKQKLSNLLVEDENERYRLDWPGKKASILKANTPITKTLRPVVEESVDFENTENLYIEGDNFEVLKILQESYLGKVKMIYIDPPYNTGKDFIYTDKFEKSTEEYEEEIGVEDEEGGRLFKNTDSNGRFHSDWLSMLYERLSVARDLLTKDGVIFISIDDNEYSNLKKICDEILGEDNFLTPIIIQSNKRGQTYKDIAKCHEYLLIYYKSDSSKLGELEKEDRSLPYSDMFGAYDLWELRNRNPKFGKHNRPNLFYPIFVDPESENEEGLFEISLEQSEEYSIEVYPLNSLGKESCWRWGKEKVLKDGIESSPKTLFAKPKRDGEWNIYEKSRKSTTKAKSIWADTSVISEQGTVEAGQLNMTGLLDFPKPLELIKRAIELSTNNNEIIMDFFAGFSTTAHSVFEKNLEDRNSRKFIMIQLPEQIDGSTEAYKQGNKTVSDIGKERIRRAGKKIKEEYTEKYQKELDKINKELQQESLEGSEDLEAQKSELEAEIEHVKNLDTGFRVYKTDSSNMKDVYYHPSKLTQEQLSTIESNIKEDRTPEDLLTQVILDLGLELSLPIEKKEILGNDVFIVQQNALVACFDEKINFDIIAEIAEIKPFKVVFRDASFKDDKDRINVEERFKRLSSETTVSVI